MAVKLFRLDLPPERVHQLVAELEQLILADLTHPAIAAPVAAGISDVFAYLAQDFVAADSLDILLRDAGPLKPADAARVVGQLASALDMAAVAGVVHGTLHPRDILMSTDDARMTGLGIARTLERVGVTPPVRRPYTAPERLAGAAWDRRADVFSLATLAFEMLTGRRITGSGEPPVDGFQALPASVRPALGRVFGRALEDEPGDRFASAADFTQALGAVLDARPGSGRASSPRRRPIEEPTPVPPEVPIPVEALPLLTDAMLESEPPHQAEAPLPAADVEPPPIAAAPDLEMVVVPPMSLDPIGESLRLMGRDPEPVLELNLSPGGIDTYEPEADLRRSEPTPPRREPEAAATFEPTVADTTRSAVWPLALALVVGIAIGFGSALLFLGRQSPDVAVVAAPSSPTERPAPTVIAEDPVRPVGEAGAKEPVPPSPAPVLASAPPARVTSAPAAGQMPRAVPPAPARRPAARARPAPRPAVEAKAPVAPVRTGPGSLLVESRPSGAEVFLDGKSIGRTPLVVSTASAGDHAIHLQLAGYRRWATSVRVAPGERARVAASLER